MTSTYTVVNPATELAIAEVTMADLATTDGLIERAADAFPGVARGREVEGARQRHALGVAHAVAVGVDVLVDNPAVGADVPPSCSRASDDL